MSEVIDHNRINPLVQLNLNLMPSLYALLKVKSVSAAAVMVRVSQPTMSRNLGQLRLIFQDDLLVRNNGHCFRTAKAQKLLPLVEKMVISAKALMDVAHDDYKERKFTVALPQHIIERYQSLLMSSLYREGLNNRVLIKARDGNILKHVLDGGYDLAVMPQRAGQEVEQVEGVVYSAQKITSVLGILVLDSHPLASRSMTFSDLGQYPLYAASTALEGLFVDYGHDRQLERVEIINYPLFSAVLGMMKAGNGMVLATGEHGYSASGGDISSRALCNAYNNYAVANSAVIAANNLPEEVPGSSDLVFKALPGDSYEVESAFVWPKCWNDDFEHRRLRKVCLDLFLKVHGIQGVCE
ncbi:LysR family transcriptional regulator [Endozoicomonas sp. Mp262]|uniref:LysR family transcriptional regulator n=1 Tax=Endozoicomonas sp. Mp262 TaxID=2919499 RepID=UPI0021DA8C61